MRDELASYSMLVHLTEFDLDYHKFILAVESFLYDLFKNLCNGMYIFPDLWRSRALSLLQSIVPWGYP